VVRTGAMRKRGHSHRYLEPTKVSSPASRRVRSTPLPTEFPDEPFFGARSGDVRDRNWRQPPHEKGPRRLKTSGTSIFGHLTRGPQGERRSIGARRLL
jgi:hypothetical protein